MSRVDGRQNDQLRPITITPGYLDFAEGSCLITCGNTRVLCAASVEEKAPLHVPEGSGWVTAEYSIASPRQPGALPPGHRQAQALPQKRGDPAAGGPVSPGLRRYGHPRPPHDHY